jgi:general secretion pathway protein K
MIDRKRQRGLALITAMLVVAIVATIAAYLNLGQQVWLRQVQNLFDRGQADNMRHAAFDWIVVLLKREAQNSQTDHLGEMWAKDLPPLPYEGGTISVKISDAQGLFNLNNLVNGDTPSNNDVDVFKHLLEVLKLNPALADAVVDWIDTGTAVRSGGAEDIEYLASTRPYRTANQWFTSVEELRLVKGFDSKTVEILRAYVTALPATGTPININTAQEEVLAALFNNAAAVKPIVATRESKPLKDQADLQNLLQGQQLPQATYEFKTSYFHVQVTIGYGRWQRTTVALIHRQPTGQPSKVLWHQPLYPKLPTDGEDEQT